MLCLAFITWIVSSCCITCVQYRGGIQYLGDIMMHVGGYLEYSTLGGYHDACGGYLEYCGGMFSTMGECSVLWGIP